MGGIRHLHLVEGVPKKEIARRLQLDVKTVRRAIGRPKPPARVSPPRPRSLDPWRDRIERWLRAEPRVQTETFESFRGGYPFRAEFCAPGKGWEKGSVEGGVRYVRNLVFRPRLAVESRAALNTAILTELEANLPLRHPDDGQSGSPCRPPHPAR